MIYYRKIEWLLSKKSNPCKVEKLGSCCLGKIGDCNEKPGSLSIKFTEAQIIFAIMQSEAAVKIREVCRKIVIK